MQASTFQQIAILQFVCVCHVVRIHIKIKSITVKHPALHNHNVLQVSTFHKIVQQLLDNVVHALQTHIVENPTITKQLVIRSQPATRGNTYQRTQVRLSEIA